MNILYVYAHPNSASLNASMKQQVEATLKTNGASVIITDLYAQGFKAVADQQDFLVDGHDANQQYFLAQQAAYQTHHLAADIQAELEKIAWADHIILQFPLWWFGMPAIMKGWFDRVMVKGFAYDTGKTFATGLLQGKTAALTVTTQSPASAYQPDGVHGATIAEFLLPIHHTLRFAGIKTLDPFIAYSAFNLDAAQQEKIMRDYQCYLAGK